VAAKVDQLSPVFQMASTTSAPQREKPRPLPVAAALVGASTVPFQSGSKILVVFLPEFVTGFGVGADLDIVSRFDSTTGGGDIESDVGGADIKLNGGGDGSVDGDGSGGRGLCRGVGLGSVAARPSRIAEEAKKGGPH